MDAETIVECVTEILKDKEETIHLKKEQLECLKHIANTKDVLAVLPTGFGKTLTGIITCSRQDF